MPHEPPHRHNGGPLSDDMREKLWNHVRAFEALDEAAADIRLDVSARKELAKQDGFDANMIAMVLKRRKAGEGETRAADDIIRIYEEGLRDQGALPLEQTRAASVARRSIEEIGRALHGEDVPPGVTKAARELEAAIRASGGTMTISSGGQSVTVGGDEESPFA